MQHLRVGLFTECYRPIQNGVVESIDALRRTLRERGHTSVCVTPRMPGYHDDDDDVVRLQSLQLPTSMGYRLTVPYIGMRARAALRDIAIVHAHSPFVTGNLALRTARSKRIPLVFTYHTRLEFYAHYAPFDVQITRAVVETWTRSFANAADAVIAPTQSTAAALRAIGVRSRIAVIASGIDLPAFGSARRRHAVRDVLGARPADISILWVGRVAREKNLELALACVAMLPAQYHLTIVGGGPDRARYERAVNALYLSGRVTFAGELPHERLPDVYASADVLLFTSASETQGLVLVEALASGLPIAAVDVPATREVAGPAAVLAPPAALALSQAVIRAAGLRQPGHPAPEMRAPDPGSGRFDRLLLGDEVLRLYESLLAA